MPDRRFRRDENPARRHRVGVGIELAMARRGRDVDGPMAGGAHVAGAALLEGLVGADLVAQVMDLAVLRRGLLAKLVSEPLRGEIALFLGHPFVQPEMRGDDELGHVGLLVVFPAATTIMAASARWHFRAFAGRRGVTFRRKPGWAAARRRAGSPGGTGRGPCVMPGQSRAHTTAPATRQSATKVMTAFTACPYSQLSRKSAQYAGAAVQFSVARLAG